MLVWQLSRQLPRPKIVELALNYGHYGGLRFGCEAAARDHFGVPARQLTAGQAALLVALLRCRRRSTRASSRTWCASRGARSCKAMAGSGFLTAGQAHQLCIEPPAFAREPHGQLTYAPEVVDAVTTAPGGDPRPREAGHAGTGGAHDARPAAADRGLGDRRPAAGGAGPAPGPQHEPGRLAGAAAGQQARPAEAGVRRRPDPGPGVRGGGRPGGEGSRAPAVRGGSSWTWARAPGWSTWPRSRATRWAHAAVHRRRAAGRPAAGARGARAAARRRGRRPGRAAAGAGRAARGGGGGDGRGDARGAGPGGRLPPPLGHSWIAPSGRGRRAPRWPRSSTPPRWSRASTRCCSSAGRSSRPWTATCPGWPCRWARRTSASWPPGRA